MAKKHNWKTLALAGVCVVLLLALWGCSNKQEVILPFPTNSAMALPTPAPAAPGSTGNVWDQWIQGQEGGLAGQGQLVVSTGTPIPTIVPTPTPTPTAAPTPTPNPNIVKYGDEGARVERVQRLLIDKGYLKGSADGDFGYATDDAVRAFQRANNLSGDGVVGPKTMEMLESSKSVSNRSASIKEKARATSKPKPVTYTASEPSTYGYLQLGSSGRAVTNLQKRLIELNYLDGSATGTFDEATHAAVIAFQQRNGQWDDGIAGQDTQSALYSDDALPARR